MLALLDDYPHSNLGHHPDLIVGLAHAACALQGRGERVRMYCQSAFVADRHLPEGIVHRPFSKTADAGRRRPELASVCADARAAGVEVLVNLFLDENHESFPRPDDGLRVVQVLHRPSGLAAARADGMPADDAGMYEYLGRIAPADLFVVHTPGAARAARNWLPARRLLQLSWPAASLAEVADRFAAAAPAADMEPHALLIGDARDAKGIHELLTALEGGGPLLRVVGQQLAGVEEGLRRRYPATRVDWVTGWVPRRRLTEAISGAAVVVFPYLESFGRHGGVSGALAQALTFAKPIVATTVLADQLPQSAGCRLIEPGNITALRHAIEWTVRNTVELHQSAQATFDHVRREHTYDLHLKRILERALEISPHCA